MKNLHLIEKASKYVEGIIFILFQDGRYSYQINKARKFISSEAGIAIEEFDFSIQSLKIIDNCIDSEWNENLLSIELLLSLTIYFSQVIVLTSAASIVLVVDDCWLNPIGTSLRVYESSVYFSPLELVVGNIENAISKQSKLHIIASSVVSQAIKVQPEVVPFDYIGSTEFLVQLDELLKNERSFLSEIPRIISNLSTRMNVPPGNLNKSQRSLKLLDKYIRSVDVLDLDEGKLLFEIVTYVGEVIANAINGEWLIDSRQSEEYGLRYHWRLNLLNNEGMKLTNLTLRISMEFSAHNRHVCNLEKLAKSFIADSKTKTKRLGGWIEEEVDWVNGLPLDFSSDFIRVSSQVLTKYIDE